RGGARQGMARRGLTDGRVADGRVARGRMARRRGVPGTFLVGLEILQVPILGIRQAQAERSHVHDIAVREALLARLDGVDPDAVLRVQIPYEHAVPAARERGVLAGKLVDLDVQVAVARSADVVRAIPL